MKKKDKIIFLPPNELLPNPYQPRNKMDDDMLLSLSENIKKFGILQPLCIRKKDHIHKININDQSVVGPKYEIISGERRWRAARRIGLEYVPCIEMKCDKKEMAYLAYSENAFREELTFFDIAASFQDMLMMSGLTQTELAKKLAISQSTIANKLRLLKLDPAEREKLLKNGISERHARTLIKIDDVNKRGQFIDKIIENELSVRETEKKISDYLNPMPPVDEKSYGANKPRIKGKINDLGIFFNSIDNIVRMGKDVGMTVEKSEKEYDDRVEITLCVKKKYQQA